MNNIIATIFSSLYQQIVLIASCLFILQLPLEKWRNRRTLITFFLSWIPIFLIQNFTGSEVVKAQQPVGLIQAVFPQKRRFGIQ